jgi:uncharacterized protein YaaN involved in tellurite resistance
MAETKPAESAPVLVPLPLGPALGSLPVLANALSPCQLIPLDRFDEARRKQVAELAGTVSMTDSNSIMTFGAEPQRRMNGFLDELLKGVRTDETGPAGELIVELATAIKTINLPKMKEEVGGQGGIAGLFAKLPLIGAHFSALRHFQETRKEIHEHLNRIEKKASVEMGRLQAENATADARARETLANLRELEVYLAAGQVALLKAREDFAAMTSKVEASQPPDPVLFSGLRDMAEQINAFETRLVRMNIAIADAMVSIPQIRTAQEAARIEIRNIMDAMLFDMPRLKGAVLQVAALNQINKAAAATEARRRVAREIGQMGADALEQAYTNAKMSQGGAADDVQLLEAVASRLLDTISKGAKISNDNRAKRAQAQQRIEALKAKLVEGLRAGAEQLGRSG